MRRTTWKGNTRIIMSPPPIPETLRSHFPFQEKGNIFSFPKFLGIGIPLFPAATVTTTGSRKGSLIFGGNSFQKALPFHTERKVIISPIFPTDALCRSVGNWALGQDDDDVVSLFCLGGGFWSSWSSFTGWSGPCAGFPGDFSGKIPHASHARIGFQGGFVLEEGGFQWDCRAACLGDFGKRAPVCVSGDSAV